MRSAPVTPTARFGDGMPTTLAAQQRSKEVQTLDDVRPQMAKVEHASPTRSIEWTDTVKDALIRRFGSLKAAAIAMGMDQSQMCRDIDSGKLNIERLQRTDAQFALIFGHLLIERAQPLTTPRAQFLDLCRQRRKIDEQIEQYAEYIA